MTGPEIKLPVDAFEALRLLRIMVDAENNPAKDYVMTQEEFQIITDFQDPRVEAAFNHGLLQLYNTLVEDSASKGPLPLDVIREIKPDLLMTGPAPAVNKSYYRHNYCDSSNSESTDLFMQYINIPPSPVLSTPPKPRLLPYTRAPPKRKCKVSADSAYIKCQWGESCDEMIHNSNPGIIKHLLSHGINLRLRTGATLCHWDGCGKKLLNAHVLRHIISVHLRLTRVKCPFCKNSYARDNSWKAHMRARHPEVLFDDHSPKKRKG
ncbi:hypothetical protein BYT27DRAFT_7337576 [Phlegmacium glaucopus]|nr:hypothetical protein BYT27DRAFT_7337576 [Phlegmacium glaucopus]